jgi:2,5-diketo-D-gluconate reductase B
MEYFSRDGIQVPKLGFGTWQITGSDCVEAVRDALELGYRHIDTAQMYGNEAEVGQAIADSGVARKEIFLTTKVLPENLDRDSCRRSTEESLDKLGTSYVDLLLIHWPNERLPLDEPLSAMRQLQEEGSVRHIGVSNFPPSYLENAVAKADILCNQVEYHPFLGQEHLLAAARRHDVMVTAYSPLARGEVADNAVLAGIASDHDTTPAQVTLRWLIQQDSVAAVPKASSHEHRRENLDVFGFSLADEEMDQIFALDRGQRLIDPSFAPTWER